MTSPLETPVVWVATGDVARPYAAEVDRQRWQLRLGDFPAEPLYTLIVDGIEVTSFDTWPGAWTRPSSPRA